MLLPTCPESPVFALKRRNLHCNTNEDEVCVRVLIVVVVVVKL